MNLRKSKALRPGYRVAARGKLLPIRDLQTERKVLQEAQESVQPVPTNIIQLSMFGEDKDVSTKRKITHDYTQKKRVGRFLSLGGGVQSSTLAEMVAEGILEVDFVIFADTKDEPKWVYEQVDYLKIRLEKVDIPLVVVSKEGSNGIMNDAKELTRFATIPLHTRTQTGMPGGMLRRQCTSEYKIAVIEQYIRNWIIERGYGHQIIDANGHTRRYINRGIYVECLIGISLDEFERMKTSPLHFQKKVYPLIDKRMSRVACEAWLKKHQLQIPNKSSCICCPYHDNEFWNTLKQDDPENWKRTVEWDDWLRDTKLRYTSMRNNLYVHFDRVPLRDADVSISDNQLPLACGGFCWT